MLEAVKSVRGISDHEIAAHLGVKYQAIQQRRSGHTRIRLGDIDRLGEALGIPGDLFRGTPQAAVRWVLDHPESGPTTFDAKGAYLSSAAA